MTTSPLLPMDVQEVTVRQRLRLWEVAVKGVPVALEVSASAASAKADRLRAHPEEAAELLKWTRANLAGRKRS